MCVLLKSSVLCVKGLDAKDIHNEIFSAYGGKCLSRKAVQNWVDKFSQGCAKVADDARRGLPVEIATEATVQLVEELIRADRRITIDSVAMGQVYQCWCGIYREIHYFRVEYRMFYVLYSFVTYFPTLPRRI
jgi:hypothetical protein